MSLAPSSPLSVVTGAGSGSAVNACIGELKIRARLGLKALRSGDRSLLERAAKVSGRKPPEPAEWKLRHVLALAAQSVGFQHWDHARQVLAGEANAGDDMGKFWHGPGCESLLNHWFASYADAAAMQQGKPRTTVLTYARQFVVVDAPYLQAIGITQRIEDAATQGFDAVREYGSARWLVWCDARMRAPVSTWVR
ncbi:MAG: hypothetical protein JWP22_3376 [Ramlibacter sp.]|jgi:hypothetical protein|nr:hypothetical protein [Ramlibacter sp.]MDB5914701.1 hypothetical protein [Ramlibacter sp.]